MKLTPQINKFKMTAYISRFNAKVSLPTKKISFKIHSKFKRKQLPDKEL